MGEKITIFIAMTAVMILMPYLITLAINGRHKDAARDIERIDTGRDILINIDGDNKLMDVEEYIVGVLPGVAGPESGDDVLAAQAVAIRTKLIFMMGDSSVLNEDNLEFTFYTKSDYIERWGKNSYSDNYKRYERAVISTVGKTME